MLNFFRNTSSSLYSLYRCYNRLFLQLCDLIGYKLPPSSVEMLAKYITVLFIYISFRNNIRDLLVVFLYETAVVL